MDAWKRPIDGDNKCRIINGWGVYDADSSTGISLEIMRKDAHTDIDRVNHSGTDAEFTREAVRYILDCPQAKGEKTVKMVVHRPKEFTAFGSEWVQLLRKDSWANVTNEYEPYMFNKYGAKIPVFRASDNSENDDGPIVTPEDTMAVYMVVDDKGDYEVMYGNPFINTSYSTEGPAAADGSTGDRWVAVQFRETLLRVGSPWAECSSDALVAGSGSYEIGAIIPAFFGHPNLNLQEYIDFADDMATTEVPTRVVLEIFTDTVKNYTRSEAQDGSLPKVIHPLKDYTKCYEAGNACPEDHSVCRTSYCELDTWEYIIEQLHTNPLVKVLGAVGVDTVSSEYGELEGVSKTVDGFYFMVNSTLESKESLGANVISVHATGEPLTDRALMNVTDTYVTRISDNVGVWNPFSWYPHTPNTKWAAIIDDVSGDLPDGTSKMQSVVDTMFDRGYGWLGVTDQTGDVTSFGTRSTYNRALLAAIKAKKVSGATRRLDERQLETKTSTYSWGCDDTLYACSPICLKQTGPVTTIAGDELCAGQPMDPCKCKCYYNVEWVCDGAQVVCEASKGIERMRVGDLVCENRGTPKPTVESMVATRQAGECVPLEVARSQYPTQQCMDMWATPAPEQEADPTPYPAYVAPVQEGEQGVQEEQEEQGEQQQLVLDSFAPVAAFALAALLQ